MTVPAKTKIPVLCGKNLSELEGTLLLLLLLLLPHLRGIFSYEIVFEGFPITLFYYGVLFIVLIMVILFARSPIAAFRQNSPNYAEILT